MIPAFPAAGGALVTGPTLALVGEAGPEIISPVDKLAGLLGGDEVQHHYYLNVQAIDPKSFRSYMESHSDVFLEMMENAAGNYQPGSTRRPRRR
jgi:hypothetical protein